MKQIFVITVLITTLLLANDEAVENKYLYFSNGNVSSIDISCKKDDDCMLTRSLQMGCSHFIAVNKKLTKKEIREFNGKEAIFWITKDLECRYTKDEYLKSLVAACKQGVCLVTKLSQNLKQKDLGWKELKHHLWQDNFGNIGLKTSKALSESVIVDRYITTMGTDKKKLKNILDINTFESVKNSSYYKDKNHVYIHYTMSGGGWFGIVEGADTLTFRNIGSIYFKDKNSVFVERNGKMEVDYETFEAFETVGSICCYAKDKNGYYDWGEKVIDTKSSEFLEIKKILDRQSVIKKKRLPKCTPKLIEEHIKEEMKRYGIERKLTSHPPCIHTLKSIK